MNSPSKETVARVRAEYPVGTLVKLVQMNDPYTKIPIGAIGEVTGVDDTATVHIKWRCGSSLGAVYGEDIIQKIEGSE
jgi:hypothetical protein